MANGLGHISAATDGLSPWWYVAAGLLLAGLVVEHHVVAGTSRSAVMSRIKTAGAIALTAAVIAVSAPIPGASLAGAQSSGALLPDLISDPPQPSFFNELNTADGQTRLVLTFDGYVHNIGAGALDVVGNPQQPNGMRQRVQSNGEWEDVGAPTVRYETDDGHNHFHLIEAIEYVLWNEFQGAQAAIGSKIGFCLVDSEQIEVGFDQSYSEELDNFCQEDNPGAQSLRMGISPGWRDIYDATTTLQWVDVSDTAPGRYWIGAITDPNDEILESNESNNELIFSERAVSIPGFAPRQIDPVAVAGDPVPFELTATAHGDVTKPIYVIEQGPTSGRIDVPIGFDLTSPSIRYFPADGFNGPDQITFSVHDAASPYPFTPPTQTIEFIVSAPNPGEGDPDEGDSGESSNAGQPPALTAPSTFFESNRGDSTRVELEVSDAIGGPARLFASGLPAGLTADADTGVVSGIALEEGIFPVEFVAVGAAPDETTTLEATWIVNPVEATSGLVQIADRSSPRDTLTRVKVATGLALELEVDGLPPGMMLDPQTSSIVGSPTEVGSFEITVRQLAPSQAGAAGENSDVEPEVLATSSFSWTIRPTTSIDFPL